MSKIKNKKRNRSHARKRKRDKPQEQPTQPKERKRRKFTRHKGNRLQIGNGTAGVLKIGSINVDGINEASKHAIEGLLYTRGFDVSLCLLLLPSQYTAFLGIGSKRDIWPIREAQHT